MRECKLSLLSFRIIVEPEKSSVSKPTSGDSEDPFSSAPFRLPGIDAYIFI